MAFLGHCSHQLLRREHIERSPKIVGDAESANSASTFTLVFNKEVIISKTSSLWCRMDVPTYTSYCRASSYRTEVYRSHTFLLWLYTCRLECGCLLGDPSFSSGVINFDLWIRVSLSKSISFTWKLYICFGSVCMQACCSTLSCHCSLSTSGEEPPRGQHTRLRSASRIKTFSVFGQFQPSLPVVICATSLSGTSVLLEYVFFSTKPLRRSIFLYSNLAQLLSRHAFMSSGSVPSLLSICNIMLLYSYSTAVEVALSRWITFGMLPLARDAAVSVGDI